MTTIIDTLLQSIDTGKPLANKLAAVESKIAEVQSNLIAIRNNLYLKEQETIEMKEKAYSIVKVMQEAGLDENAICQAIAKQFKLTVPNTKKANKISQEPMQDMTNDGLEFIGRHPDGIGMKAVAERFGSTDKIKLATLVKNLVENGSLNKTGNKRGTLYHPN